MNKWLGIGRLTSDPQITTSQSGMLVASYTIAVNRPRTANGQEAADFIRCKAFGKGAEFAQNYLHKGTKIAIEGHIQTGNYEKDGVKHYTTDIMVDRHEFVESKKPQGDAGDTAYIAPAASYTNAPAAPAQNNGFTQVEDDDMPF